MRRVFISFFIVYAALAQAQKINPSTQISWPVNCSAISPFYSVYSNLCVSGLGVPLPLSTGDGGTGASDPATGLANLGGVSLSPSADQNILTTNGKTKYNGSELCTAGNGLCAYSLPPTVMQTNSDQTFGAHAFNLASSTLLTLPANFAVGAYTITNPGASGTLALTSQIPSVGTWGALNYPTWTSGIPFVKMTAAGVFALDNNTYITTSGVSGMTQYGLPIAASATTVTGSVQPAAWTTGHTFVPVWQPSGSALEPTIVDANTLSVSYATTATTAITATTATTATNVATTSTSTNAYYHLAFVSSNATSSQGVDVGNTTYNPSKDDLGVTTVNLLPVAGDARNDSWLGVGVPVACCVRGGYNTGLGSGALAAVTDSYGVSDNTGVGASALANVTTGNTDTGLGYNAVTSAATDIDETVLGANAVGNGSHTVTLGGSTVTGAYIGSTPLVTTTGTQVLTNKTLASPTFTGTVTAPLTTAGVVTTTSGGTLGSEATITTGQMPVAQATRSVAVSDIYPATTDDLLITVLNPATAVHLTRWSCGVTGLTSVITNLVSGGASLIADMTATVATPSGDPNTVSTSTWVSGSCSSQTTYCPVGAHTSVVLHVGAISGTPSATTSLNCALDYTVN